MNKKIKFSAKVCYVLYYGIARFLPASTSFLSLGSKRVRSMLVKRFIDFAGNNINVERGALFSRNISIGDNSGIGINAYIPNPGVTIGNNVMMGPDCMIFTRNHAFDRLDVPMIEQGFGEIKPVIIRDNVWIGARVIILPGVIIGEGAIIGAGSVVTKNVNNNSIVGGNPARILKYRNSEDCSFTD